MNDADASDRYREFAFEPTAAEQTQDFYLTYGRRLGARKCFSSDSGAPGLRFSVWAPNAQRVEVVFGMPTIGYIADDGDGIDPARPVLSLRRGPMGTWDSDILPDFAPFEGAPYMYCITNAQGRTVYRTDIFSRDQIGRGGTDPAGAHFSGDPSSLDGTKSCSLVVSADSVARDFGASDGPRVSDGEFWQTDFTPGLAVPSRIEDLIIYELHVNALGAGRTGPGTLANAVDLIPYLADLGVNAVELLPMSEYSGGFGWGYGDSHHFVIESAAGGRDEYKHFVRECHRRGIAVIQDVCYNHFDVNAVRDEWQYDSDAPEQNIYYLSLIHI